MVELDCLGDMCPIPMLNLKQCKMLKEGEQIKLVTDHSCRYHSINQKNLLISPIGVLIYIFIMKRIC